MAGDAYGAETQEEPKAQEDIRKQQAAKDQQEVIALAGADWEKQVAEYLVGCPVSCGCPPADLKNAWAQSACLISADGRYCPSPDRLRV